MPASSSASSPPRKPSGWRAARAWTSSRCHRPRSLRSAVSGITVASSTSSRKKTKRRARNSATGSCAKSSCVPRSTSTTTKSKRRWPNGFFSTAARSRSRSCSADARSRTPRSGNGCSTESPKTSRTAPSWNARPSSKARTCFSSWLREPLRSVRRASSTSRRTRRTTKPTPSCTPKTSTTTMPARGREHGDHGRGRQHRGSQCLRSRRTAVRRSA